MRDLFCIRCFVNKIKNLETLANGSMVILAIVAAAVLIRAEFFPASSQKHALRAGDRLAVENVDWRTHRATLVLALQVGCRFCSESAPFYSKVAAALEQSDVHVVAVFPQTTELALKYLGRLRVPIGDVREQLLSTMNVFGTPTIILVDRNGRIVRTWIGKLNEEGEAEVISTALALRQG
jgi:Redoxin